MEMVAVPWGRGWGRRLGARGQAGLPVCAGMLGPLCHARPAGARGAGLSSGGTV